MDVSRNEVKYGVLNLRIVTKEKICRSTYVKVHQILLSKTNFCNMCNS